VFASISEVSAGLGRQAEWQFVELGLIGCGAVYARMRSPGVVKVQVAADRTAGLADNVVGLQIYLFIFDAAPQPLDEDIVSLSPFAVSPTLVFDAPVVQIPNRTRDKRSVQSLLKSEFSMTRATSSDMSLDVASSQPGLMAKHAN
jgi:hypothetical protein